MTLLHFQSIRNYGTLRRYNCNMPYCLNLMRNPCKVAGLPLQAHANYWTWSIHFGLGMN